ncbi:hypothetical protein GCM10018773_23120 [Streptomyces candidus]|nr:hypothetical protein GCM10018773_23120 [Streptomyces candidus]
MVTTFGTRCGTVVRIPSTALAPCAPVPPPAPRLPLATRRIRLPAVPFLRDYAAVGGGPEGRGISDRTGRTTDSS